MFTPGDKLEFGHYTVLKELGSGGMGVVFQCRDEYLQREIAVKMLLPELMSDGDTVELFRREARLAAQLEHPHIVTIHSVGMENRGGKVHHYIAMEYLPGGNLRRRLSKEKLSLEQALEWMRQLSSALSYAHKRGVVHEDIKPDNIFITQDGNLKVGDFGLAHIVTGAFERQGKGTPAYMSPELCKGAPRDHRSDIYSLGAVFFELLTGERPFNAASMIEMAMKHATAPIPSARSLRSEVPLVLDKAIRYMMAKTPESRLQSLDDALPSIEKLLLEVKAVRMGVATAKPETGETGADGVEGVEELLATMSASSAQGTGASTPETKGAGGNVADEDHITVDVDINLPGIEGAVSAGRSAAASQSQGPFADRIGGSTAGKSMPGQEEGPAIPEGSWSGKIQRTGGGPPAKVRAESQKETKEPADGGVASLPGFKEEPAGIDYRKTTIRLEGVPSPDEVTKLFDMDGSVKEGRGNRSRVTEPERPELPEELGRDLPLVWRFKTWGPIGWAASPVINKSKRLLYLCSSDSVLYALDLSDGGYRWHFHSAGPMVSRPVLGGDRLVCSSCDGYVYCLEASNGDLIWKFDTGGAVVSCPVVAGDTVYVASSDGGLRALSMESGQVNWIYRANAAIACSPQVTERSVFIVAKDHYVHAISVDKGWRKWIYEMKGSTVAACMASSDSVFCASSAGDVACLDLEGGNSVWTYEGQSPVWAPGIVDFTAVTFAGADGRIFSLDRYKGSMNWHIVAPDRIIGGLVTYGSSLYAACLNGQLLSLNARTGEQQWHARISETVHSTPLFTAQTAYVGTLSGELLALELPRKK